MVLYGLICCMKNTNFTNEENIYNILINSITSYYLGIYTNYDNLLNID